MASDALDRARAGDREAFAELVEPHRRELTLHCYRMLGSLQDAEDALQETLVAAWLGLEGFEGRSSVRTWLYRIATNRCLNLRRSSRRRPSAQDSLPVAPPAPTSTGEVVWLQPYPDALLDDPPDPAPGPEAAYEQREAVSLAFIRVLQLLPARQRAVLLLRDVLGYRARETAEMLAMTEDAANAALKRARASVDASPDPPGRLTVNAEQARLLDRFLAAFTGGDLDGLLELFTDDVWVRMPPLPLEYHGRDAAAEFFSALGLHRAGITRMLRIGVNGQPAWGEYVTDAGTGTQHLIGLLVVDVRGDRISALTHFDTATAGHLGLPRSL